MLSRTGEYALRAVLYLAQAEGGRPLPANAVADALDLPRNYLSKTLNRLAKVGVLKSERGPRGGFRLAKPPTMVRVSDVVGDFASLRGPAACLLGGRPCEPANPCRAHARWTSWTSTITSMMESTMLSDLLGVSRTGRVHGAVLMDATVTRNGTRN